MQNIHADYPVEGTHYSFEAGSKKPSYEEAMQRYHGALANAHGVAAEEAFTERDENRHSAAASYHRQAFARFAQ